MTLAPRAGPRIRTDPVHAAVTPVRRSHRNARHPAEGPGRETALSAAYSPFLVPLVRHVRQTSISRRIAMYDTAPDPAEAENEATRAVQAALDRRDNGGSTGR